MGTGTLILEKRGYKTIVLRNFGVADKEMGPAANELVKGSGVIERDATHKLIRNQ